eukprot:CAMPEP_0113587204 /NCGR_PEP_ID=MMETSP0015_2-20120614/34757_1 /TAXON_ID=2838 /ORGANISM="Odontella" /LENGTH=446 /DNA_ID=CAMNT_0000492795 /DNA_START=51 /DNA_END=1391 /DNA_ORIENTATION=+ /assembly_acc=CAM_ASM_000160
MLGVQKRSRAYGGTERATDLPRFISHTHEAQSKQKKGASRKRSKKDRGTSGSVCLVGWDDTLGRPIYEVVKGGDGVQGTDSRNEKRDGDVASSSKAKDDNGNTRSAEENTQLVDKSAGTDVGKMPAHKVLRSYGARKRGRAALSEAAATVLDDCKGVALSLKGKKQRVCRSESSSLRIEITDFSSTASPNIPVTPERSKEKASEDGTRLSPSPFMEGNSICSLLDSATKLEKSKKVVRRRKAQIKMKSGGDMKLSRQIQPVKLFAPLTSKTDAFAVSHEEYRDITGPSEFRCSEVKCLEPEPPSVKVENSKESAASPEFHSGRRRNKKNVAIVERNMEIPVPEARKEARQISSATSLSSAKAFFDRLDLTQPLVLDKSGQRSPGRGCIRTSRVTNIRCPKMRNEYKSYRLAAKSSGVNPLTIKEFAKQRVSYFQKSVLFDGFLDES